MNMVFRSQESALALIVDPVTEFATRMEITAIRRQKRREDRVVVLLDGDHRVALSAEVVARAGLRRGISIAESQLASLVAEDSEIRAREAALRLLDRRARSREGMRRALARKGFHSDAIERCISRLTDAGLLNDHAFATAFVAERMRSRPRGVKGLKAELRARGIGGEIAGAAIAEAMAAGAADEMELAVRAARKFRRKAGEPPAATRRRLRGYLARRGFSAETISTYVSRRNAGEPESH